MSAPHRNFHISTDKYKCWLNEKSVLDQIEVVCLLYIWSAHSDNAHTCQHLPKII